LPGLLADLMGNYFTGDGETLPGCNERVSGSVRFGYAISC